MNTIITKISTSKNISTVNGPGYNTLICMYTVVQGEGSKRTSITKHMTEVEANELRKKLGAN